MTTTDRFLKAHASYSHCGLCGRVPQSKREEANRAPLRWWDADDGWKISALCRWCWEEVSEDRPKPTDYAARLTNGVCDDEDTDEDAPEALE